MNNIIFGWINKYIILKPLHLIESNNNISDIPEISLDSQISNIDILRGENKNLDLDDTSLDEIKDLLSQNTDIAESEIMEIASNAFFKKRSSKNQVLNSSGKTYEEIVTDPSYIKGPIKEKKETNRKRKQRR